MSAHIHRITFDIPRKDDKVHDLYTIPRIGEIVIFDKREWSGWHRYKVIKVINNIDKSGAPFGWVGIYMNKVTVVLEEA